MSEEKGEADFMEAKRALGESRAFVLVAITITGEVEVHSYSPQYLDSLALAKQTELLLPELEGAVNPIIAYKEEDGEEEE